MGSQKASEKKSIVEDIALGRSLVIVGTHALFQDQIQYAKLALVVMDEQHKFGVKQRLSLVQKTQNYTPHQLHMSATPIPRSLAMTQYADLKLAILDELPPGRQPVQTAVLNQNKKPQVFARIAEQARDKQQIYWVCPSIELNPDFPLEAAENTFSELKETYPDLSIAIVHGQMSLEDKNQALDGFVKGDVDILVSTTVIEVGVNVPNASIMVIDNAERFGLAQLHQLRGRVGRGNQKSHCLLLYNSPLSQVAQKRLELMRSTTDGFVLAEEDLKIRGTGEILGTRQSGLLSFKVADLERDQDLLDQVEALSDRVTQQTEIMDFIIKRWLGEREEFAKV
jgi:ATP-dependent DNA helicase RecG